MFGYFKGYRTYLFAAAIAAMAGAQALGYPIPEWVYALLGAGGFAGLRAVDK
jgi:hypothetical protein